jgi:hypothetical protein
VTPAAASKKPMVVLTQSGVTPNGAAQWKANLMPNLDFGILNKTLNGGSVLPVRDSKRNVTTSDQDSLEKATKLKAHKNLDSSSSRGNKLQTSSFNTFDDPTLLAAASSLGLVLGSNEQEVSNFLNSLRDLEGKRLSENELLVNRNVANVDETTSICSLDENFDLEALNLICSEITEDLGDGGCDTLCLQTPISHYKKV